MRAWVKLISNTVTPWSLYNMLLQHVCTLILQDDKKQAEVREDEGMGKADLKYGDSMVFIQNVITA